MSWGHLRCLLMIFLTLFASCWEGASRLLMILSSWIGSHLIYALWNNPCKVVHFSSICSISIVAFSSLSDINFSLLSVASLHRIVICMASAIIAKIIRPQNGNPQNRDLLDVSKILWIPSRASDHRFLCKAENRNFICLLSNLAEVWGPNGSDGRRMSFEKTTSLLLSSKVKVCVIILVIMTSFRKTLSKLCTFYNERWSVPNLP